VKEQKMEKIRYPVIPEVQRIARRAKMPYSDVAEAMVRLSLLARGEGAAAVSKQQLTDTMNANSFELLREYDSGVSLWVSDSLEQVLLNDGKASREVSFAEAVKVLRDGLEADPSGGSTSDPRGEWTFFNLLHLKLKQFEKRKAR
jgi:hypothetical protein